MSDRTSTLRMLREARTKVINHAAAAERVNQTLEKLEWEQRRTVLDEELIRLQGLEGDPPPKRVFISYNVRSGLLYFKHIATLLNSAGFEVVDGFSESRGTDGNVLKMVLKQLRETTIYLGILSKEMEVQGERQTRWAPGVWVSEEKGMALALEKPFILLIHRDIHEDFWSKTTKDKHHVFFEDREFEARALEVVEEAKKRHEECLLRYGIRSRE